MFSIVYLLPGLVTADLSCTDIVIQSKQTVEEHSQAHHGSGQQPACVEPWIENHELGSVET